MTKTKSIKSTYQLTIRIGKENQPDAKIKKFKNVPVSKEYKELIKCLLSIEAAKIMIGVNITLEIDGKKATRDLPSFRARAAFNNKLHAFHLMKSMHWIFK